MEMAHTRLHREICAAICGDGHCSELVWIGNPAWVGVNADVRFDLLAFCVIDGCGIRWHVEAG